MTEWAQAGTHPPQRTQPTRTKHLPQENSSLPPFRGEARCRNHGPGRQLVEWAQAGTHPPQRTQPTRTKHLPQENSSLPPFRGEARWGVGGTERPPAPEWPPAPLPPPSLRPIVIPTPPHPPYIPAPLPVIPAQAGMGCALRWRCFAPMVGGRAVPACAGMTERRSGRRRAPGKRSQPPTPHLTSPLKGGRDELGKGGEGSGGGGRAGSCLRRNDGLAQE